MSQRIIAQGFDGCTDCTEILILRKCLTIIVLLQIRSKFQCSNHMAFLIRICCTLDFSNQDIQDNLTTFLAACRID